MQPSLKEKIQHYLYYNYVPQKKDLAWLEDPLRSKAEPFEYSPEGAAAVLDATIDGLLHRVSVDGYVVVPISGGWDSRILLGAAIERFDRDQLKTVSYGAPGQLDFDIGGQIAKSFGLEHHAVDLSKVEFTWEAMRASVQESPWTYFPDHYFNRLAASQVAQSEKDIVLSGFMGDPLTGGHLSSASTQEEAIEEFVSKQRREKAIRLYSPGYDPRLALPELPEESAIAYSELLDLGVRQTACIAPIVTPQRQWRAWGGDMGRMPSTGARVLAPFAHPKWAGYWLGMPNEFKRGQKLYLEMMRYKFPGLAAEPSKYSLGARPDARAELIVKAKNKLRHCMKRVSLGAFSYPDPGLNYLDFAQAFRVREDYINVLDQAFSLLREKNELPWLDLASIKRRHASNVSNHENALLVLTGLAFNIDIETQR